MQVVESDTPRIINGNLVYRQHHRRARARMRAAIIQWPTPVARAMTAREPHSKRNVTRPELPRLMKAVNNKSNAITKPTTFTTPSERVTIPPAISLAFDKPNDRSTPNAAGATTAPKKSAAPNQHASKMSRVMFRTYDLSPRIKRMIDRQDT